MFGSAGQAVWELKNTFDTIEHGDGVVFVAHHLAVLSLACIGMGTMHHIYMPFFFGISEASSAVLSLLALFDENLGVKGMAKAFPITKLVLGVTFALLFVVFRIVLWFQIAYYFWRDSLAVAHVDIATLNFEEFSLVGLATWQQLSWGWILLCNVGLSTLQVVWLGQIFYTAAQELSAMRTHTAAKSE